MKLIDDEELREKIRLKCLNDWDIELSEDQVTMGIIEQEEQKLSIFHNQLWPNKRNYKDKSDNKWKTRVTWDKTIDGYRAIALRNGFSGIDKTNFVESSGDLVMASVTVYKVQSDGKRYPFVGEARFDEFAPRNKEGEVNLTGQWKTAPYNQLSIAAQRQALRIAFQECNESEMIVAPDTAAAVPEHEPELEPSRGESLVESDEDGDDGDDEKNGSQGKYVGIPRKGGFKFGQMYNKDERIVLKSKKDDGAFSLALDSGFAVIVNDEGYETSRRKRSDDNPGGRPWKEGAKFYDGEEVEKIASAKKDPQCVWLALDSGFKVKLDRWGKVLKRKELKPKEEKSEDKSENESKDDSKDEKKSGLLSVDKFRKLSSKEEMRSSLIPALAQWCREINGGKKISPKQAYLEFVGVEIEPGQSMGMEDYPVLYESIVEAIEEHQNKE